MTDPSSCTISPDRWAWAIAPFPASVEGAACGTTQPEFPSWKRQLAAFDDDPHAPTGPGDLAAARAVCARCPQLAECADYARRSCTEHGVLAGMTAAERATRRRKRDRVDLRDRQVKRLAELGMSSGDIADELGVDVTAIRRHLRGWDRRVG